MVVVIVNARGVRIRGRGKLGHVAPRHGVASIKLRPAVRQRRAGAFYLKRRERGKQARSKNAGRQQSTRSDVRSAPMLPSLARSSAARDARGLRPLTPARPAPRGHAQAPAVLDHTRTLPQGDGSAGPTFTGGVVGGERNLVILDAGDVLDDAFPVSSPRIDAEGLGDQMPGPRPNRAMAAM
jgi:hypothetical protein